MPYPSNVRSEDLHKLVNFLDFFQRIDAIESEEEKRTMLDFDEIQEFYNELSVTGFLLVFDWRSWLNQNEIYKDTENDIEEYVRKADIDTLRKLMTSYVRGDRFTEGLFDGVILHGHVSKILIRLKELIDRQQ